MDCFLGGGTTAIAAAKLGRKFIGMELDETYFRRAVARFERETQTSGIFAEVA
jgi:DNA modification methylase